MSEIKPTDADRKRAREFVTDHLPFSPRHAGLMIDDLALRLAAAEGGEDE